MRKFEHIYTEFSHIKNCNISRGKRLKIIFCFLTLCYSITSSYAFAEAMVTGVKGSNYEVFDSGYPREISTLSILKPGNKVVITEGDTEIYISQEGSSMILNSTNTPYVVPTPVSSSVFKDTWKVAMSSFQEFIRHKKKEQFLISRGLDMPIKLIGIGNGNNYLPMSLPMFRLFFDNGNSPIIVSMESEKYGNVFKVEISGGFVGIPLEGLAKGKYDIHLSRKGEVENALVVRTVNIVSNEELPDNVREMFSMVDSPAREQLASVLLSENKDWKFAAIQYAYIVGQMDLVNAIIIRRLK